MDHPAISAEEVTKRLTRLSPHRVHESNWLKSLLCKLGFHRWFYPQLGHLDSRRSDRLLPLVREDQGAQLGAELEPWRALHEPTTERKG